MDSQVNNILAGDEAAVTSMGGDHVESETSY
jgi:hypothetical protein